MTSNNNKLKRQILEAGRYLSKQDEGLKGLIKTFGLPELRTDRDPYQALVSSIISQQISGHATQAIRGRFLALFPGSDFPRPQQLAEEDISSLRSAGLSQRKSEYVKAIAQAFLIPNFPASGFNEMTDAEVTEKLTAIRGVGQWTTDMFMIFTLGRLDILPLNDQGIRNGMRIFFGLEQHPSPVEMLDLTAHWKPYRSVASWYLWKLVDEPEVR